MPWRRAADKSMFERHDPYLVALSVAIASLGGYTGFALAARIRNTPGVSNRLLLAGAAAFLAVGIWTMHFVGMLAAPLPADTVYLVLPTIISFLICALVVGISLFFVSTGVPSLKRVTSSAVLLGVGIGGVGWGGQYLFVIPARDLAVVIHCGNYRRSGQEQTAVMLALIREAVLPAFA